MFGMAQIFLVQPKWTIGAMKLTRRQKVKQREGRTLIMYSPDSHFQHSCYFAGLARCIYGARPTQVQVQSLRDLTAELWEQAPEQLLQKTAARAGMKTSADYVKGIRESFGRAAGPLAVMAALCPSASPCTDDTVHHMGAS
eukprot:2902200-Amphidinium_carterae.2